MEIELLDSAEQVLQAGEGIWEDLSSEALDQAIFQHRARIKDLVIALGGSHEGGVEPGRPCAHSPAIVTGDLAGAHAIAASSREPTPAPSDVPLVSTSDGGGLNVDDLDPSEWQVPPHCIPIHANVTTYDWRKVSLGVCHPHFRVSTNG